jgi:hypothetical protein
LAASLVPWDDQAFVHAYQRARAAAVNEGLTINGPKAATRVEGLLRAAGYPAARITVARSAEDALLHRAQWTVYRDGEPMSGA